MAGSVLASRGTCKGELPVRKPDGWRQNGLFGLFLRIKRR